jgi:hypothetical protein
MVKERFKIGFANLTEAHFARQLLPLAVTLSVRWLQKNQ